MNKTNSLSQSMLTTLFVYWNIELSWAISIGSLPYNKESSTEGPAVTCPVICEYIENKAKCNDVGKNITVIPRLPGYIHDIEFSGNYLPNVTKETFAGIVPLKLGKLNISRNEIKEISADAFRSLKHLQILDMSLNNFSCNVFEHALNGIQNSKIKTIKLKGMKWTNLESRMFHALQKTNISSLTLSENQLSELNGSVFAELKQLKYLDVSDDVIYSLHLRGLESLKYLDASDNVMFSLHLRRLESLKYLDLHENDILLKSYIFCNIQKGWIQNIELLNLQCNHLRSVKSITFGFLKKLKYLYLNENPVETVDDNMLVQMKSLTALRHSYLYHIRKTEDYAFKTKTLRKLFFARLNAKPERIFKHCPKLEHLDLSCNFLKLPLDPSKMFSKTLALRTVNLQKTGLKTMPLIFFTIFQNLTNVILNGNRISTWNGKQIFGKSASLRKIYIRRNHITVINETSSPPSLLSSLKILDLADNQISCTCDNLWFRDWIREHKYKNITLLGYPKNYRCMSPPKMRDDNVLFTNYNPTEQSCAEECVRMYAVISVTGLIVLIITSITIILILYKCRWNIRFQIYYMKKRYAMKSTDEDFVYDAFVSYSDSDREWVHSMLRSNLEKNADNVLFANYNPTKQSCAVEPAWIYALISVTGLIAFTITTILILYKCRWNIRYKIYRMKRNKCTKMIPNNEDFVYAGYVIYSDSDREWVHEKFRPNLEDNEGHRLCIRLRDFEAGKPIADNIVKNMNLSREVILVISNNFAQDEWCQFEFNLAQNRLVKDGKDFIIVMLNEVNSDNLYESLYALITTKSYALWTEEETGKTLFWEQVINAMKIIYNKRATVYQTESYTV